MPCCAEVEGLPWRRLAAGAGLGLVLLSCATCTSASEFTVEHAAIRLAGAVYVLDADITFEFSKEALEALENGVPLTVILDTELVRKRWLLWDQTIAEQQARYQLEVHALSGRYVVKSLHSGLTRSFRTLEEAMRALGTIHNLPLFDNRLIRRNGNYTVRLRARLDIEALPAPLRPLAYLSGLWRLSSEWYTWPVRH